MLLSFLNHQEDCPDCPLLLYWHVEDNLLRMKATFKATIKNESLCDTQKTLINY